MKGQLRRALSGGGPGRVRRLQANPCPKTRGAEREPDGLGDARRLGAGDLVRRQQRQRRIERRDLGEQSPRAGEVEGQRARVARRPRAGRKPARVGGRPPAERGLDERGVEGERHGLPHGLAAGESPVGPEGEESDPPGRSGDDLETQRGPRGRRRDRRGMEGPAGAKPPERRRVIGHRVERESRTLRGLPSPGRRRFEHQPVGRELDHPVGPGPAPGTRGAGNGDPQTRMRQEREDGGVRLGKDDLDRRALAPPHLSHEAVRATERPHPGRRPLRWLVGGDALSESRDDVVDPERRAVVEPDVRADAEGPDEPVPRDDPGRREGGLDVALLTERDEPLVEESHRQEIGGHRRRPGIEARRNARHADVKVTVRRREADACAREQRDQRRDGCRASRPTAAPVPPGGLGSHRRPL